MTTKTPQEVAYLARLREVAKTSAMATLAALRAIKQIEADDGEILAASAIAASIKIHDLADKPAQLTQRLMAFTDRQTQSRHVVGSLSTMWSPGWDPDADKAQEELAARVMAYRIKAASEILDRLENEGDESDA